MVAFPVSKPMPLTATCPDRAISSPIASAVASSTCAISFTSTAVWWYDANSFQESVLVERCLLRKGELRCGRC